MPVVYHNKTIAIGRDIKLQILIWKPNRHGISKELLLTTPDQVDLGISSLVNDCGFKPTIYVLNTDGSFQTNLLKWDVKKTKYYV